MTRTRIVAFAGVCLAALGLAAGAIIKGAQQAESQRRPTAASERDQALDPAQVTAKPHIVFRSTAMGPTFGNVGVVPLDRPDGPRATTNLACERIYATRTHGLCLASDAGIVTTYQGVMLDATLAPTTTFPLIGIPSRARISPDDRWTAMTMFVSGHSYVQTGFSTATTIRDADTGSLYANLEDFTVHRNGKVYRSVDLNVWGVTFADSDRFFATVGSRGRTWLVEGSVAGREMHTLRENAECPSLSPDGTRIAYKFRTGNGVWRLHVLDLRTDADTALAETRSVDDQVEWLDDKRVLYGLPRSDSAETDVWVAAADGSGTPEVFLPLAWSPAVVH